ncbi:TIGR03862 family flavoprotein [Crenobacter cavernae]|uniref:TIGR03862 family flavoprotein n=1 Tax=Crenobacter cavernae TaxID=2290923 RepID=A0ABY0FFA6_9NEIS|nr:TIGR03862 family flavoprotein [Crenobacter cavernae]RXZ43782.1 TIGR03862 family flavoprotein [Crenobacter cavernae]
MPATRSIPRVAVVGGGPAGLIAAEVLIEAGLQVDLYDAMPSVGRKFLLAGVGGMNLTHSEPFEPFLARYGAKSAQLQPMLAEFCGPDLRDWAHGLGIETFVGSSGRVFPAEMKAAPLLRAWLARLRESGVHIHVRHRWLGWDSRGALRFATPAGRKTAKTDAVLLALGGGSWAKLGSDGAWVTTLAERGVDVAPLVPANCGFDIGWSEHFSAKFAGEPLKAVIASCTDAEGKALSRRGEFVVTAGGVEGSLIYALSASLRDAIAAKGSATLTLDLAPDRSAEWVAAEVAHPRGSRSLSSHLQSRLGLKGVKVGLLWEVLGKDGMADAAKLAAAIKALPLTLAAPRPIDEAISSAGGVTFGALDAKLMVEALPGVFCAGEMLDWEAPTGGYLLTACFATGRAAARGVLDWLAARPVAKKRKAATRSEPDA